MSDKKCTFIERDEGASRGYLPQWGEVRLDPVQNSINAWGRITNFFLQQRVFALNLLFYYYSFIIDIPFKTWHRLLLQVK